MTAEPIGHYTGESVICHECFLYWRDRLAKHDSPELEKLLASEPTDFEAYPDGFTCDDCGKVVVP